MFVMSSSTRHHEYLTPKYEISDWITVKRSSVPNITSWNFGLGLKDSANTNYSVIHYHYIKTNNEKNSTHNIFTVLFNSELDMKLII